MSTTVRTFHDANFFNELPICCKRTHLNHENSSRKVTQRSQREFFGTIHSFHVKAHTLDNTDISRKLLIHQTHQVVKPMYLTVYLSDPKCLFKR